MTSLQAHYQDSQAPLGSMIRERAKADTSRGDFTPQRAPFSRMKAWSTNEWSQPWKLRTTSEKAKEVWDLHDQTIWAKRPDRLLPK